VTSVDLSKMPKSVAYGSPAHSKVPCNSLDCFRKVERAMQFPNTRNIYLRHQELCGDGIAKTLIVATASSPTVEGIEITDTSITNPQVCQFVDECKGLRSSCVVIVKHDERDDWVGKSEAPEFSRRDVRVMAPQITLGENKDTVILCAIPHKSEQSIIVVKPFPPNERQVKHLLNIFCYLLNDSAIAKTSNERQRFWFLVFIFFLQKLQHFLLAAFYFRN